jgi:hypothetical protein
MLVSLRNLNAMGEETVLNFTANSLDKNYIYVS